MVLVYAHRGYLVNGDPENSIPAFQTAIHYGAGGIELDVHLTSDRKLICFHDDTLVKHGNLSAIKDISFKELKSIELAEGVFIPSLEEVCELLGNKIAMNIEVKMRNDGINELVEVINQYGLKKEKKKLIISSFYHHPLKYIRELDPDIPTGLIFEFARGQLNTARELQCDAIHPYYNKLPKDYTRLPSKLGSFLHKYYVHKTIENAHKYDIIVNPWVVNEKNYIEGALRRNVDGIITDEIEKVINIINNYLK